MTITPVNGEPTCFMVSSRTLQCPHCTKRIGANRKKFLVPGDPCPNCGTQLKRVMPHKVDTAFLFPIGQCACWHGVTLAKKAGEMTQAQRSKLSRGEQDALRCEHLKAARNFLLNKEMAHYELKRLKNGNGRKEEQAA